MSKYPILGKSLDGLYPRCVWCEGEIYMPHVLEYSKGRVAHHGCGKKLPKSYVRLVSRGKEEDEHRHVPKA